MPEIKTFRNDFFISYTHKEKDMDAASAMQSLLEHYAIPREIKTRIGRERPIRVFRDQTELSASSDLTEAIREQLQDSEYLIVLCSPEAKASRWVREEIRMFMQFRGRQYILPVLIEGEPSEAFPELLMEKEPMAADCRGKSIHEVRTRAGQEKFRLLAPLLHCSYDELVQRRKVYRIKAALTAACAAVVLAGGFGAFTLSQNLKITKLNKENEKKQAQLLSARAEDLLAGGERAASIRVAQEALRKAPGLGAGQLALENALYVYRKGSGDSLSVIDSMPSGKELIEISDLDTKNRVFCAADKGGTFYFWDLSDRHLLSVYEANSTVSSFTSRWYSRVFLCADGCAVIFNDQSMTGFDYLKGEVIWELDQETWTGGRNVMSYKQTSMCVNEDRTRLFKADLSSGGDVILAEINTADGALLRSFTVRFDEKDSYSLHEISAITLSADEKELAVGINHEDSDGLKESWLVRIDAASETAAWTGHADGELLDAAAFDQDRLIGVYAWRSILPSSVSLAESRPYSVCCYLPSGQTAWKQTGYFVDRDGQVLIDITDHESQIPRKVISIVISTQQLTFSEDGELMSMHTYADEITGYNQGTENSAYIITRDGTGRKVLIREGTETDRLLNTDLGIRVSSAFYDAEEKEWIVLPENAKKAVVYGKGEDPSIETIDFLPPAKDALFSPDGKFCLLREMQNEPGLSSMSLWNMEKNEKCWSAVSPTEGRSFRYAGLTDEYMYCGAGNTFYLYSLKEERLTGAWTAPESFQKETEDFGRAVLWRDAREELHVFVEGFGTGWAHLKGDYLQPAEIYSREEWDALCEQLAEKAGIQLPEDRYATVEGHYMIYQESVGSDQDPDRSFLYVLDLDTLCFLPVPEIPTQNLMGEDNLYCLSEDGKMLVINGKDHMLHLISLPDGKETEAIDLKEKRALSFTVTPDKEKLLVQTDDFLLLCCSISAGTAKVCHNTAEMPLRKWRFTGADEFIAGYSSGVLSGGYYRWRPEEEDTYLPFSYLSSCSWFTGTYGYYLDKDTMRRIPIRSEQELMEMGDRYLEDKTFSEFELKQYGIG